MTSGDGDDRAADLATRLAASEVEASALRAELDQTGRGMVALYAELIEQHEQLERARAEAEQTSLAKAAFLATMSHEIRSPLAAMTGFTALLLGTELTPEQLDYVETIRAAGNHLRDVVDDILDLSKIESGHLELEKIPFELVACVEDAVSLVAHAAAAKRLPLAALFGPDLPGQVCGDPVRLRQILVNLLSNAVKFTAAGSVTVEVGAVAGAGAGGAGAAGGAAPGDEPTDDRWLAFQVRDTGIGITPQTAERLFNPFTQADSSTARIHGGTGLGLSICRELVERMGGQITLASTPGAGSVFTCTIPVRVVAPADTDQPAAPPGPLPAGTRILLVHETEVVVEAIRRHLTGWGAQVVTAASVAQAARRVDEWSTAAVALVEAPDPDTFAGRLAQLARCRGRRDLPVVALAAPGSGQWLASVAGDVCAAIHLPVRRAQLREALTVALSQPSAAASASRRAPVRTPARAHGLRILLADDDRDNQRAAALLLGRLGHRVDTVNDGAAAVVAIRAGDYDLVLMDVRMPGVDGLAATRQVRRHPAGRRARIVAITAGATPELRRACLDAGMDDFLAKPFDSAELLRITAATPHRPPQPAAPPPAAGLRVLYVDDNPMMITLVERMLSRDADLTVSTAARGDTAMAMAVTEQPDVILLDLNLADMSGEDLLRQLRTGAATRSIPTVIVSGDTAPATVQRLVGLGAADYLTKPFDLTRLRAVLTAAVAAVPH